MSRALLEHAVPWLVDHPDEMSVLEVEGEGDLTILELSVHPEDVGKIIGRRGRIIRSLRALVRAAGQREGRSVTLEVVD
ncbi:MAG TPA: KH domain-containing protein [Actinomycetota bacterium]|nr:KH domain-containing protein [Actinomycetota bacterium]